MGNTVFSSFGEARKSLTDNKFAYTIWVTGKGPKRQNPSHDEQQYLDDYARIAVFLCNTDQFKTALREVSRQLWDIYRGFDPQTRNKFTRALGVLARQKHFDFQNRFSLATNNAYIAGNPDTAPIGIKLIGGDPQLGYMLRNKLFWKDSMDSRHGEHTHSLQWLAIAEGCQTTARAAELYANTGNYRAPSQDDVKGDRSLIMWQWLADCFPPDMSKFATAKFLNGETLESNSYRSPQLIMDSLLLGNPRDKQNHFVATYLFGRYKNRGWLTLEKRKVTDIQSTAINMYRMGDRSEHGWKPSDNSPTARLIRDPAVYANLTARTDDPPSKLTFEMTFHDQPGKLSYYYSE